LPAPDEAENSDQTQGVAV